MMTACVLSRSADAPDRILAAYRGRGDEPVLDRAVVALGLAQVHGDRAQRVIGAHEPRAGRRRTCGALPLDRDVADARRLEDLAAALAAEPGDRRDLARELAGRGLGRQTVALEVRGELGRHDVRA